MTLQGKAAQVMPSELGFEHVCWYAASSCTTAAFPPEEDPPPRPCLYSDVQDTERTPLRPNTQAQNICESHLCLTFCILAS